MPTETCPTGASACAVALTPAEIIAARAQRDRVENAVLDRECADQSRESWEAFVARVKGGERG